MKRRGLIERSLLPWEVFWAILAFGLFLFLVTPFVMISLTSVGSDWFGSRWLPKGLTTKWFILGLRTVAVGEYLLNTLIIGVLAAFFSLLFGTPIAWVISKTGFKYRSFLLVLFLTPRMVPPLSYAIGLSRFFYSIHLIDTHVGVALSHLAICLPYVVIILSTAFDGLDDRILDAGRVLGAHGTTFFGRVLLPLILPGIISAGLFAFITSYNEFTMTIMTYGPHTITMPIMTYSIIGEGYWEIGAAISIIIMMPSICFLFWVINRIKPEQLLGGVKGT
jgi:putative spermidine/putrescine transport system permease protein